MLTVQSRSKIMYTNKVVHHVHQHTHTHQHTINHHRFYLFLSPTLNSVEPSPHRSRLTGIITYSFSQLMDMLSHVAHQTKGVGEDKWRTELLGNNCIAWKYQWDWAEKDVWPHEENNFMKMFNFFLKSSFSTDVYKLYTNPDQSQNSDFSQLLYTVDPPIPEIWV